MRKFFYPLSVLFAIHFQSAYAQSPAQYTFQSTQLKATVHADGSIFNHGMDGYFIPLQPGLAEKTLLNGSGLWLAGINSAGNLTGAAMLDQSSDFRPGALPAPDSETAGNLTQVWQLNCGDIAGHIQDFSDNGVVDVPNARIFGFPVRYNNFFDQYNNPDDTLPSGNQALAAYFDTTEDGIFNPDAGEFPVVDVRGCPLLHTMEEMTWSVSNDQLSAPHPSGWAAMNMELQTQAFVFKSTVQSALNQTLFVKYKLINRGSEALDSCFVGVYNNMAIGNPADDFIGIIPEKQLVFAYNGDENDEDGFGNAIPVLGINLLRAPLAPVGADVAELAWSSAVSIPDPENLSPEEMYHLLNGRLADGSPAPNDGLMYAGDPNDPASNSEIAVGNTAGKRRSLMSAGPFTLLPGAVNEVILAYHYSYVPGNTVLQQLEALFQQSDEIQNLFDNCFVGAENSCDASLEAPETSVRHNIVLYPNPASQSVSIESLVSGFSRIEVLDVLGRHVQTVAYETPVLQYQMPIDHLAAGFYLIRVGGQSLPLVVQH
jgi:Secretion system C-terminal sorting domain